MIRVSLWADTGNADGNIGGAELTMEEFAKVAPKSVKLVGELDAAEAVIFGNCVQYPPSGLAALAGKRVIRYHNDLARHEHPEVREWLEANAIHVFTSPMHQELYGLDGFDVPPALDLGAYRYGRRNGDRRGAVALGAWQNPGKGQWLLAEWAEQNETLDVYGGGPFQPAGTAINTLGMIPASEVPATLRAYQTFVHLPTDPEPFGRAVVEAWAAGCRVITNRNVGALHWIQNDPRGLETAGQDFWDVVLG